jgi:DNA-binding transcriptional regulator YiaG
MQIRSPDKRKSRNRRNNNSADKRPPARKDSGGGRPVSSDTSCWSGEEVRREPYAYTVCGLDSIFLLNGYQVSYHDGEEFVSVIDVEGLHRAIGRHLVLHRKGLSPKEVRFLRKTMDLTQAELAAKLGNDAQSVARWEKGTCEMPGTAEKLLRATFLAENMADDGDLALLRKLLVSVMDELDSVDEIKPPQAQFKLGERWNEAA